jgi:hypothetical protein
MSRFGTAMRTTQTFITAMTTARRVAARRFTRAEVKATPRDVAVVTAAAGEDEQG